MPQNVKLAEAGKSEDAPRLIDRIARWKTDKELEGARDPKLIETWPADEQTAWRDLFADADLFVKVVRAGMTQVTLNGSLTAAARAQSHELTLIKGNAYVFDLESRDFDTLLRLEDAAGRRITEHDDVGTGIRNARIVFTPKADGVYRLIASTQRESGIGAYRLRIAALKDAK